MQYIIRGENIVLTDSLKEYVEKKIGRLERYFESPLSSDVHVTLSVVRDIHTIEVTIPIVGSLLRAEERNSDMYASIDLVVEKLERQIRKHKTKMNRKFRQNGGLRALVKENASDFVVSPEFDEEENYELVRRKKFDLKPMDVEEAILQMNMLGHNFFVFSNSQNSKVNVVYQRSDGKYGLIESE